MKIKAGLAKYIQEKSFKGKTNDKKTYMWSTNPKNIFMHCPKK